MSRHLKWVAVGFFLNPMLWFALHHLATHRR